MVLFWSSWGQHKHWVRFIRRENCELSKEQPFALSYGDHFSSTPKVYRSKLQLEDSWQRSTPFSSPGPANRANRKAIDISLGLQNEEQSIVQPNSPVQRFPCVLLEGHEQFIRRFLPIDSRRFQSGPPIAWEAEQFNEKELNRPNQQQETSFTDQSNPIIS